MQLAGSRALSGGRPACRTSRASTRRRPLVVAAAAPQPSAGGAPAAAAVETEEGTMNIEFLQRGDRSRRPENVPGSFYVDATCIDCDACRTYSPETFARVGEQSAVHSQPTSEEGRVRALQALLSCPTFSIHVTDRTPQELRAAQEGLPRPVQGTRNVFLCGWRNVKSYGSESYIIRRPEGNVMVDCPRFNPVLARRIAELGGVRWIFLTHKDDVGDHAQWAAHFGAPRILHEGEVVPDTEAVEVKLSGEGPWRLPDGSGDIELVFTPGHTSHHVCLYLAPERAIFTGDHLSASYEEGPGELFIFTKFNWHSVEQQLGSVRKLLDYDWLTVLPGHGRPAHVRDAADRLRAVSALLQRHGAQPVEAPPAAAGAK